MSYNKKDIIMEQLSLGKKAGEISRELGFSRSYIHQIKRKNVIEPKQSIINVTEIVKGSTLNEFTINGFTIKCDDLILVKILNGLTSLISLNTNLELKPNNLYIFCGKDKTKIKVLEIDKTGIWVYYKRTHGQKFIWPKESESLLIDKRQLLWLLDGLSVIQKSAHTEQYYNY